MNASLALRNNVLGIYNLADTRLEQSYYWLCYPKYDKKLTRLNKQEEVRGFWIYTWEHYRFQSIMVDFTSNVNTVLMTESETKFISMIQNLKKAWPLLLRSGTLPVFDQVQTIFNTKHQSWFWCREANCQFYFFLSGNIFLSPAPGTTSLWNTHYLRLSFLT